MHTPLYSPLSALMSTLKKLSVIKLISSVTSLLGDVGDFRRQAGFGHGVKPTNPGHHRALQRLQVGGDLRRPWIRRARESAIQVHRRSLLVSHGPQPRSQSLAMMIWFTSRRTRISSSVGTPPSSADSCRRCSSPSLQPLRQSQCSAIRVGPHSRSSYMPDRA